MKALFAAFLLLLGFWGTAMALPHGGAIFVPGCSFTGSTTNGSCLNTSNVANWFGPDGNSFFWATNSNNCDSNSNCDYVICTGPNFAGCTGFDKATEAIWQSSNSYFRRTFTTCGQLWQFYDGSNRGWASSPGSKLTSFTNTTTSTNYASLAEMFAAVSSGNSLSIGTQPAGFNCFAEAIGWSTANLTLTFAAGTKFADSQNSKGILDVGTGANNTTINGGDFAGAIRLDDSSTGFLLENATVHSGCGAIGTTCILSGNGNGTVTLTSDTVYDGGDSADFGQDHNVYISASSATNDAAANAQITGLVSYNVTNGAWTLKMRPEGITTQNHVTQSIIGCTHSSVSGNVCEQNGVVDMPCGGRFLIDFTTLERGPNGDNFYMARALEELRNGTTQCPATFASTNSFTFDHDIFIWDGPSPGATVTSAVCVAGVDGSGNCENSGMPGGGVTCTITNSVLVGDSSNGITLSPGAGCLGSGGAAVCSDGTNRCYASRTLAAAGENWTGSDQFGNAAPAFPYLPPHP